MADKSIYEIGDSLEALAVKARQWFTINNVEVPDGARKWQSSSVRKNEIPPGTGITSLRRYGFNVTTLISCILEDPTIKAYTYSPIVKENISELLGLSWVSDILVKGHRVVIVKCDQCLLEEEVQYGTLQRMRKSLNRFCRYCRNAGGKEKSLSTYDIFEGFDVVSKSSDSRIKYKCTKCNSEIERTMAHISNAEYFVCEFCYPKFNFGARHYTELGYFDSKIEYEAYKILLKYLDSSLIVRQKKYDELFNTDSKHTADFYIPHIPLVLEVTSKYNKIGQKYKDTAEWKKSLSNIVVFAYSLEEVEDIVRPFSKDNGLTVENWRSVLCCRFVRGQEDAASV